MITLEWQEQDGYGFYKTKVDVAAGATSDYIKLNFNTETSVAVYPTNRARCEFSVSPLADVEAGTATWIAWPLGNVRTESADTIIGVASAIRLVSDAGSATMEVLAR